MPQWAWALTLQPTDKDGGSNPAAVPVSDVLGASCSYGKQGGALNYGGGSMTLALNNSTSKYTPQGGGTYTNSEFLGKVARLTANVTDSPSGAPASQLNLPGTTGSHATGRAYARQLTLPGSTGDFAQATFASANVTGDVDIRAQILTDWSSPASFGGIISKRGTGDTGEWLFQFDGSGNIRLTRFSDGAALDWTSTAAPNTVFSAHEVGWVRVTHDVDNGSSENVATFFTSTDGVTYTQLGSAVTRSGTYTATTTSNPVTVGAARSNGNAAFSGEVHAAQVHDGIDGTQVVAFDPTLGLVGASSFTESTGETWSINGNAALSHVTGDLEVVARVKATDFTTGVIQTIVSTGSTAFEFNIGTTGKLMLRVNNVNKSSSETPPLDDGEIYWLRVRRVRSTGAIEFFYAEDHPTEPTEWTSTGTASSTAGSITSSTFATRVGLRANDFSDTEANPFGGSIHAVVIRDGISGTDAVNFDPAQGAVGGTSFVAATRETWNLTGSASLSSPAPAWTHGAPAVFSGVVTDVNWSFDNRFESIMTLTVSDILTMLGTLSFAETDSGNGLDVASGAAATSISAVLAAANAVTSQITQTTVLNPSGDTGQTMQAVANFTGNAGELLQLIEQSDGGDVFVRHGLPVNGTNIYNALTFRTRGQESISDAVTGVLDLVPLNIFASPLTTAGLEPHEFQRIDFASGATASYSQVAFTREGGSVQKASVASANLNAFGARALPRTGLLTNSDSDTLDLANAFLNQYGVGLVPPLAVRAIEMPPIVEGINNGYELVKFSIGDGCPVRFRPAGASATIVVAGVISGINWDITPGSSNMTVQLEDGDQSVSFVLDSSEFGLLDISRLG